MSKVDGVEFKVDDMEFEVKALKGISGYETVLETVFDTCAMMIDLKLTQLTTMAAINTGIATQDYTGKPGLFTAHDGVSFGDERMVYQKLLEDTLSDIAAKHINGKVVEPFEVVKEFAKLVDKITFEFI